MLNVLAASPVSNRSLGAPAKSSGTGLHVQRRLVATMITLSVSPPSFPDDPPGPPIPSFDADMDLDGEDVWDMFGAL